MTSGQGDLRILLLGKSGAGKSATGNTILGRNAFKKSSETCEKQERGLDGKSIAVIDTPGLFSTSITKEQVNAEIERCVEMSAPGPHVLLLVIKLGVRFTEEERNSVQWIQQKFGKEALLRTIILFTHTDQLKGLSLEQYISKSHYLPKIVESCGGRYHSFNNEDRNNQQQVPELLQKIDALRRKQGPDPYTPVMFKRAQTEITVKDRMNLLNLQHVFIIIILIGAILLGIQQWKNRRQNEEHKLKSHILQMEHEVNQLENEFQKKKQEEQQLENKFQQNKQEENQLKNELSGNGQGEQLLKYDLRQKEQDEQHLENELQHKEQEENQLIHELQQKEKEKEQLIHELSEKEKEKEQLENELLLQKADNEEHMKNEVKEEQKEQEMHRLKGELLQKEKEKHQLNETFLLNEEEKHQLNKKLLQKRQEKHQLNEKLLQNEQEKHKLGGKLLQKAKEKHQLGGKLLQKAQEKKKLEKELQQKQQEIEHLTNDLRHEK